MKKKKREKKIPTENLSISEKLFLENEVKTNALCINCLMILILIFVAFGLITIFGITKTTAKWSGLVLIFADIMVFIILFFARVLGYANTVSKYLILLGLIFLCTVSYFLYPFTTILLFFGPTLLSIKYYEPKLTLSVTIVAFVAFVSIVILSTHLDSVSFEVQMLHLEQGTEWGQTLSYNIKYYIIPRSLVFAIEAVVGYRIARAGRSLVRDQAEFITNTALMSAELSTAAAIQSASLAKPDFTVPNGNIELSAFAKTAKEVGGDFYDYFMINENILVVVVADVSDKGLPSAMFAVEAQSYLHFAFSESFQKDVNDEIEYVDLEQAVNAVNRQLTLHNMDGMFVTMWIGCIDTRTGVGKYVNAGHTLPFIRHADGSIDLIENEPQLFLGSFENADLQPKIIRLREGDTILLYSDGATDVRNSKDETFGAERLEAAIARARIKASENASKCVLDSITGSIDKFIGNNSPYDDITMLALTFKDKYSSEKKILETVTDEECATRVMDFVSASLEKRKFNKQFRRNLNVIIDEICDNESCYAYDGEAGPLTVELHIGDNYISMRFIDEGVEFNPADAKKPNVDNGPQIGGFGIYFVENLADKVEYKYQDGKNMLTVINVWNM